MCQNFAICYSTVSIWDGTDINAKNILAYLITSLSSHQIYLSLSLSLSHLRSYHAMPLTTTSCHANPIIQRWFVWFGGFDLIMPCRFDFITPLTTTTPCRFVWPPHHATSIFVCFKDAGLCWWMWVCLIWWMWVCAGGGFGMWVCECGGLLGIFFFFFFF